MFNLTNKIALITGASRGLGWSMAQSLAKAGAHVVLNARDEKLLSERVKTLSEQGLSAQAAAFDVTNFEAAQACVSDLQKQWGKIDILIANAGINHRQAIQDFELENFEKDFEADEVFCCIGTTAKKTSDKTVYKAIDYGIPVTAAKLSKRNNIPTFMVVSAMGANARSNIFYNKTKGEMERDVLLQKIINTYVLQPSIIGGNRKETRIGEKIGLFIFKIIQPLFIGKLQNYKIIEAEEIAQAMVNLANSKNSKEKIITSNTIKNISKTKNN